MSKVDWSNLPYGMRGVFVDVPGLGRYVVRPENTGSRLWRAYHNSQRTGYNGSKEECIAAVERVVRAHFVTTSTDTLRHQLRWDTPPHRKRIEIQVADVTQLGRYSAVFTQRETYRAALFSRTVGLIVLKLDNNTMEEAIEQCNGHYWGGI